MMDISEQSHKAIASALKEAIGRYRGNGEESVLTDIHLHPGQESAGTYGHCRMGEL